MKWGGGEKAPLRIGSPNPKTKMSTSYELDKPNCLLMGPKTHLLSCLAKTKGTRSRRPQKKQKRSKLSAVNPSCIMYMFWDPPLLLSPPR